MAKIILIAAIDKRNAIGYNNKLLFHIPNDLKRFKELTTGHTVVMGRKTFESLPKGALPNRRNIVLSRNKDLCYPNTEIFSSIEDALKSCTQAEKVFIIGGEQIYSTCIGFADELEITEIDKTAEHSDAFFPIIDKNIWKVKEIKEYKTDNICYSYVSYYK